MTDLPTRMRCVEIAEPGGPKVLRPAEADVPRPGAEEILIAIDYAGVNRPDALQRAGSYAPPPDASPLPGLEAAGRVAAVGPSVSRWAVGDAVCALLPGGGYAEYALTHQDHALSVPRGFDMAQAAAIPETYFTVWSNVVMRGGLEAGERILIHGGSSGIGTTAIQIAKLLGARVFVTAGSEEKCAACMTLGADVAINYREEDFVERLRREGGADLILDMVGGDYIPRNLRALAVEGRLVQIAFLRGPKTELNLAPLMMQRQTITGSTLRPQSQEAKARIAEALRKHVWPWLEAGRLGPVMDETFALEDAAAAHTRMEASAHIGKIVLRVAE